ncbi:proline dehydrogenase family protein [Saccharomonospora saliphila]|uniref:proline dehydrogenase family protein n=1 Tax=Saccharomonospora saliphila TaxID=369829 RepID=UPI00036A1847|nr:proline dehydrogenase family protein [Saccharomonospora saliphila]
MLRSTLLAAARSPRVRSMTESSPVAQVMVQRFVAGPDVEDATRTAAELAADGRRITLDHLGEDTTDAAQARRTTLAYRTLLRELGEAELAATADVSVKLSAVGQSLPHDGERIALDNARSICSAAAAVGATVTLDMEDHTTVDSTLGIVSALRADFPWVGAVLQAYLYRTVTDCAELAEAGSRVRLCKGAYAEPASVAHQSKSDVDRAYVRCLKLLMSGRGYPMVATHDPTMIAIADHVAREAGRTSADHEYQMLYGIRADQQRALAAAGRTMRVYVPYGEAWYGYYLRRLAERPANVAFFLRALAR